MDAITLLARGYFPKEIPTPFVTEPFSTIVGVLTLKDVQPSPENDRLITRPATHNLARPGGQRRRLHIPNPFSYWRLCQLLEDNWGTVKGYYGTSTYSRSKPTEDPSGTRALRTESDGDGLPLIRAENRRVARYVLRTDVSRFYSSIYTHGIEWALEGKANVKANLKAKKGGVPPRFGKSLDTRVRELQDLQSLGIPIGPEASLALAEIVACAIDRLPMERGLLGFRFMDDYEIGFNHARTPKADWYLLSKHWVSLSLLSTRARPALMSFRLSSTTLGGPQ